MSSTYAITRNQIITLALRKLGVIELDDMNPDPATIANASMSLNLLVKQLGTSGLKLWKINELILPLVAGQTDYSIGSAVGNNLITDKPLKVIQGFIRNNQVTPPTDTQVTIMSRQEYNLLGSKQSTGVLNSVFYEVRRDNGIMHVYVNPNATMAANYTLHFIAQQPINDILTASEIPDFPIEWLNCLVWNLADQMAIEYGVPSNHRSEIVARAKAYREEMEDWDVETTSTFFQPDYRMYVPNNRNRT
jgi:hypothetical protein